MKVITAPSQRQTDDISIFMAGGITDCPDWQKQMLELLNDCCITVFNPRRKNFPIGDPKAAPKQIKWEYARLREADAVMFWFPCDTLCPIVLYELGAALERSNQDIFIGIHPDYKRRQDVEVQTKLANRDTGSCVKIVYSLEELAAQVAEWASVGW